MHYRVEVTPFKTTWKWDAMTHRIGGPAVICKNGVEEYWYLGHEYSKTGYNLLMDDMKKNIRYDVDVTEDYTTYRIDGVLHREDGPAITWADGDKSWWKRGKRHREDGPAIEYASGGKEWWVNNQKHREDGPAEISGNGDKSWWVNGQRHREDGPAVEYANGKKEYYLHDEWYFAWLYKLLLILKRLRS
jgi:hypothetical protein